MTMPSSAAPVIARAIDLPPLLAKKSYFLLGPRQTGKSFLIRHTMPGVRLYDLLDSSTYLTLSRHPERIAELELTTPRTLPCRVTVMTVTRAREHQSAGPSIALDNPTGCDT